jgi:ribonuclease G
MLKKIVINDSPFETRVALLEDGNPVEFLIERKTQNDIAGNIYKGKVQRVLPGMQAAFIDIGQKQAAFIHVNDLLNLSGEEAGEPVSEESEDGQGGSCRNLPIETCLKEGQEIMVHVAKAPIGTKGARVTSHVSLPGRFLVLMPFSNHIGISRRILDDEERQRLKSMVAELRKEPSGYIVRTAAEGVDIDKIAHEMLFLDNLWHTIGQRFKNATVPTLLHRELNISLRAVRDLLTHEADKIIIDSDDGYRAILSFLDQFAPALKGSVEKYEGHEPLFDAYNLEGDLSRALKRKIWLKSGSYIVIEQTEALVAIDVNTGRYVGKHNLEETILKTNLEAVKEIAYQIRLRDIGGIIIIDFIDMEKKGHPEKVFNALIDALKKDKSKTHVLPMSEIGLIQMTRKRVRQSLNSQLCEACTYCEGEGHLFSRTSICFNIYREIIRQGNDFAGSAILLHVNPEIADMLHNEHNRLIGQIEQEIERRVIIYPNQRYHIEEFQIYEKTGKMEV